MDWQELIDDEWYYIPLLITVCLWSFAIGWFLGWVLTKIH
jgi:hypothetical protein